MKYYTQTIPVTLAEKLKEKGYPQDQDAHHLFADGKTYEAFWATERELVEIENARDAGTLISVPFYSEVFDWLMEKGFSCEIYGRGAGYDYVICKECSNCTRGTRVAYNNYEGPNDGGCWDSWRDAANSAIEKAITLI